MGIVEEECDESLFWIDVLTTLELVQSKRVEDLRREANEILSITVSSIKTARRNATRDRRSETGNRKDFSK
jgi:four helix bundle protein